MQSMGKRRKKEKVNMDQHLVVRVPAALLDGLRQAAEKDRRGLSDYVRIMVEDHLADLKKKRR